METLVAPAAAGNPRNTEAAMIVLDNGELLLAYSDFFHGGGGDHDLARISAKRSADGGRTWGERFTLQDNVGDRNVMSVSLLRLHDGNIAFAYLRKNSERDLKAFLRISADEAETWSEPQVISTEAGYNETNNDRLVQMKSGRLIAPTSWSGDVNLGHYVSFCYYSDDLGRTWKRSKNQCDAPGVGADEPAVAETGAGRLLMVFRTTQGRIFKARSEDGGESWGEPSPVEEMVSPCAPVNVKRIPATGDLLGVWNHHPTSRVPLTAAISPDQGETWSHIRNVDEGPSSGYAYPSILFHDAEVYLTYYHNDGRFLHLKLQVLPIEWFYGR
jgi:sialidase-1